MNESKAQPDAGQWRRTVLGLGSRVLGLGDLEPSIVGTYGALRISVLMLAFLLPLHLVVLGRLWWDVDIKGSLSAYYGEDASGPLRDWFVGYLFATAVLLFVYHGFTESENWALNFAAICLVVVALVPWEGHPLSAWHGVAATVFFGLAAYVGIVEAQTTVTPKLMKCARRLRFYRVVYPVLAIVMALFVVLGWLFGSLYDKYHSVLILEWLGVYAFGLYWLVKSIELWQSGAEVKVVRGQLKRRPNPNFLWRNLWRNPNRFWRNPNRWQLELERKDKSTTE